MYARLPATKIAAVWLPAAAAAWLLAPAAGPVFAQPDVADFVAYPEFEDIRISPGGTYLAFTQKTDEREFLIVFHADDLTPVSRTSLGADIDIGTFDWANEERILISPERSFGRAIDFKQPTGEILGIDADGRRLSVLFGYNAGTQQTGTRLRARQAVNAAGDIIDWLPDDPRNVIVQSVGYGLEGELNQAWTMDVNSGRLRPLVKSPIPNGVFVTDAEHEIRFVRGVNENNVGELYGLDDRGRWELLATDEDDSRWLVPLASFGRDGLWFVRDRREKGIWGVSLWNPATLEKEPLFHHALADISVLYFDNERQNWAVQYEDHFPAYFYPDQSHRLVALHQQLRASFGDEVNVQIMDETDDLDAVIAYVSGPRNPGEFVLIDTATAEPRMRMPRFPNLPSEALSRMDPVELRVRDGETVRGFITIPNVAEPENLPLVVLPHGGPHGVADVWGYDYQSQLLASRGYAVLQLNFRGSGGRGMEFLEAGYGEWGGRMQDDITDATLWAIENGIADPARICIYGASYGAYAALTGAYKEPSLYRCVIGMSGVYDLNLMFEAGDVSDARRGLSFLREALGEDETLLASRSPVANAERIEAAVMLIHGEQDERAPIEHAVRMRDALAAQGKDVVWLTERGERHGILSEENRVEVYEEILAFLERNIGG